MTASGVHRAMGTAAETEYDTKADTDFDKDIESGGRMKDSCRCQTRMNTYASNWAKDGGEKWQGRDPELVHSCPVGEGVTTG